MKVVNINLIIKIMESNLSNTENGVESSISQDKVNNSNLYLDETDSKGVPLLRKVEKYPDLPEDEFIPIDFSLFEDKLITNFPKEDYLINKKGEVKNKNTGKIIKRSQKQERGKSKARYCMINFYGVKQICLHRLVAITFLINPDIITYSVVNHIDHNTFNNKLSNLEWVTITENTNKKNGKSSEISKNLLIKYVAIDNNGSEKFFITSKDCNRSVIESIERAIKRNKKYNNYYWKKEKRVTKREETLKLIGFSGNLEDYKWFEHWKYPGLYVCKEGFIKFNNKLLYNINSDGYVRVGFKFKDKNVNLKAHRIIIEFIIKRDLLSEELVDHINTTRYDNSFTNLRIVDYKENRNNTITRQKLLGKKSVLTDLYGNFLDYDHFENLKKNYFHTENRMNRKELTDCNILFKQYFLLDIDNREVITTKMEKVLYVFQSDKKTLVGAYSSPDMASKELEESKGLIYKYLKSGNLSPSSHYFLKGPEAVKLVISLGHGNVINFDIKDNK